MTLGSTWIHVLERGHQYDGKHLIRHVALRSSEKFDDRLLADNVGGMYRKTRSDRPIMS